jgi:hypothetical protein
MLFKTDSLGKEYSSMKIHARLEKLEKKVIGDDELWAVFLIKPRKKRKIALLRSISTKVILLLRTVSLSEAYLPPPLPLKRSFCIRSNINQWRFRLKIHESLDPS